MDKDHSNISKINKNPVKKLCKPQTCNITGINQLLNYLSTFREKMELLVDNPNKSGGTSPFPVYSIQICKLTGQAFY